MSQDVIRALQDKIRLFCEERDWDRFHGPKDLAIGVVTEASELLELFRFLSEEESFALVSDPKHRGAVEDELADVFFFVLRIAQRFDIDLVLASERKLEKNEARYPAGKLRGSNRKYTEL